MNRESLKEIQDENVERVRILSQTGDDLRTEDNHIIRLSAIKKYPEIVEALSAATANICAIEDLSFSEALAGALDEVFLDAVKKNKIESVQALLQAGADIKRGRGEGLLTIALVEDNLEMVKLLIKEGADVDDDDGYPIRDSATNGYTEIVELLIQAGADVDIYEGEALIEAADHGHIEIVKLLLQAGADVNERYGAALVTAVDNDHADIVKLLLQYGADFDDDVFYRAAKIGHKKTLRVLCKPVIFLTTFLLGR